jgi:hypothetical protein
MWIRSMLREAKRGTINVINEQGLGRQGMLVTLSNNLKSI